MVDSPLMKRLREAAQDLGGKAVEDFLSSEGRAEAIGLAIKGAQGGRKSFDEQAGRVLGAMGFATTCDLDRVGRKIGRLRKRMLELLSQLDQE